MKKNTQNNQKQYFLNDVLINGISISYPDNWKVRNPIGDEYCKTINCETSAAMRGDLDYKIYDPNITSDYIYISARSSEGNDCLTSALPCPLPKTFPNVKTTQIKGLVFQTDSTDSKVINIYDQIIENTKLTDEWTKSPKFGLYYSSNLNPPSEYYRIIDRKNKNFLDITYEQQSNTVPVFSLVFNKGESVITWGDVWQRGYLPGTCTD